jgi:hypothetical protein
MLVEVFQLGIQTERNKQRWISVKERLPEYIDEKDYSENVFTWNGKFIRVMARCYEYDGWLWGDCMGDIYGDPEVDDDYSDVTHWMPLPAPPKGDAVQSLIEEQLKGVKE